MGSGRPLSVISQPQKTQQPVLVIPLHTWVGLGASLTRTATWSRQRTIRKANFRGLGLEGQDRLHDGVFGGVHRLDQFPLVAFLGFIVTPRILFHRVQRELNMVEFSPVWPCS